MVTGRTYLESVRSDVRPARNAIASTFFVHGLLFASWTAHIPAVAGRLGLSDTGLGLALLGAPVGAVLALTLTGAALPRVGSRDAVRVGLALYCLAGLLVGVAGSAPGLFLALLGWGFGQGALDVSMNTQAVYVERAAGRPVMSGLHGAWGLGAFVGAGLGTASVAVGIGLFAQLAVLGPLALAVALAGSARLLPDEAHDRVGQRRWSPPPPVLLLLAVAAFASMLCEGAAADWSAVYLRRTTHASAAVGGLGYTVFALALLVVRLAGNRLLQKRSARRLIPMLALGGSAGVGAGLATSDTAAMLAGLALLGAGLSLIVPSAFAAAGRLPGRHPGRSVATVSGLGWVGFVAGPPLIGALAGASSLRLALVLLPVLTVLAAAASARALP